MDNINLMLDNLIRLTAENRIQWALDGIFLEYQCWAGVESVKIRIDVVYPGSYELSINNVRVEKVDFERIITLWRSVKAYIKRAKKLAGEEKIREHREGINTIAKLKS